MNSRILIVILLAASGVATAATQGARLFETDLEAKIVGDDLDLWFALANHSRHPVCYLVTKAGAVTVSMKDGTGRTILLTDDMHEDTNPLPIQVVPNDGQRHRVYWQRIHAFDSAADAQNALTAETNISLNDCHALITEPFEEHEVYRSTVSAQITR